MKYSEKLKTKGCYFTSDSTDWWFGNRNSGCSCEKVWDNQGKEIEIDNEFDIKLDDLFWSCVYGD